MAANSTICSHSKLIIPLFNWTNRSIRWGAISVAHTRQSKSFPTPVNNIRGKLWALSQQISSFPSGQLGMSNITNSEQISNYLLIHKMRVFNQQSHTWKCTEYIWLFSSWLLIDNMHRTSDNVSYWHRRRVQWTAQNQSGCLATFGNWFLKKLQIYLSHKRIKKKKDRCGWHSFWKPLPVYLHLGHWELRQLSHNRLFKAFPKKVAAAQPPRSDIIMEKTPKC